MAVVNIPPDGHIYQLGQLPGTIHVYNTNNPAAPNTIYSLTIINVNAWVNVNIAPGGTNSYPANNNMTYIQNNGPSRLQVLYVGAETHSLEDIGASQVEEMPVA